MGAAVPLRFYCNVSTSLHVLFFFAINILILDFILVKDVSLIRVFLTINLYFHLNLRLLQGSHGLESELRGPEFTEVFAITWFGSCIVTLNVKLLRGTM